MPADPAGQLLHVTAEHSGGESPPNANAAGERLRVMQPSAREADWEPVLTATACLLREPNGSEQETTSMRSPQAVQQVD